MGTTIEIEKFLKMSENISIVDVRSPKEFAHARIPNAVNIPIFSDKEREEVGICYKNKGREAAVLLGLRIVGPKLADFVESAKRITSENRLLIHCWRGGMRSFSMAWLFDTAGIQTYTLSGGYKSYRRYVKAQFAKEWKIIVLGGMTGSGKTEILKEISVNNHQVIDLEGLANHKGSAFGALGQKEQYSSEQFENNLFECLKKFDIKKPVWLEDESKTIGKIGLPEELYTQMRKAPVINIIIPIEERIKWLVSEYGNFNQQALISSIIKIQKRLGGNDAKLAIDAVNNKELGEAVKIVLHYYDKAYQFGLSQRNGQTIYPLPLKNANHSKNAELVLEFTKNLKVW